MYNSIAQRPDFKSALRVVKMVLNTQCCQYLWLTMWFHAKNPKKHSKNQNRWFYYVNSAPKLRNHQTYPKKNFALNRDLLKLFYMYGIFWMIPGESSCPGGSEYVWQRGVDSLEGRVTAARSWPLFREKKNQLRRCNEKLLGHNFDRRAKSSWEKIFNIYKNFLSGGFRSTIKIVAG